MDVEIDSIECQQFGPGVSLIAERDFLQLNFRSTAFHLPDGHDHRFAAQGSVPNRLAAQGGKLWFRSHEFCVGYHWMAFFPFSDNTRFKRDRSYRPERSGIWRPRKPAS